MAKGKSGEVISVPLNMSGIDRCSWVHKSIIKRSWSQKDVVPHECWMLSEVLKLLE